MLTKLPYVFISYQIRDRRIAADIRLMLAEYGIATFLAHEDIEVSTPWQDKILEELGKADIFMCLLSRHYTQSPWCVQESGVACFRNMHIIPLSLDGTIPEGFLASVQSRKVDPDRIRLEDFIDGLKAYDPALVVAMLTAGLRNASSYRRVERYFKPLAGLLDDLDDTQGRDLLAVWFDNPYVHTHRGCVAGYLPLLLHRFGHTLDPRKAHFLKRKTAAAPGSR